MIARGKFYPWERESDFDIGDRKIEKGDYIIVRSPDEDKSSALFEAIEVSGFKEKSSSAGTIVRVATAEDTETIKRYISKKEDSLRFARMQVNRHKLAMKLIDAQFSIDGAKLVFGFVASQRVDFRELVKDLSRHFQKSIRMIQVGSRDEARNFGGIGNCGRTLCCASFLKKIESVTLNDAKTQRLDTRGANRLSGFCGRLKCCLAYESKLYEELNAKMPSVGQDVMTEKGRAKVVDIFALERKVKVALPDNTYLFLSADSVTAAEEKK